MRILFIGALLAFSGPAQANSTEVALEMAGVIVGAQECEIGLDVGKLTAHMMKKVEPGDMGFSSTLSMMISGTEYKMKEKTALEKTLMCAQVQRNIDHYGWQAAE